MRSHDTFSAFSARTRVFGGAARRRAPPSIRFDTIRYDARVTTTYASLSRASGPRARPRKAPLCLRGFSRARVEALSSFQAFSPAYAYAYLGVGKMGVKFSGTDHLSLGRYWHTPPAMCAPPLRVVH